MTGDKYYKVIDQDTGLYLTNYRDDKSRAWTWRGSLFTKEQFARTSLRSRGVREADGVVKPYRFRLIEYVLVESSTKVPF